MTFGSTQRPEGFRELEQLRRLTNVIRLGRVQHIGETEIVLDDGAVPTSADTAHIDCTADGSCNGLISCPPGLPCTVHCSGSGSCFQYIDCTAATACLINCEEHINGFEPI